MRTEIEIDQWLRKFGYLHEGGSRDDAVIAMQKRYGLKPDGEVGPLTDRAMGLFRCGHHDGPTRKAITIPGSTDCRWQKSSLGYYLPPNFKLSNLSAKVSQDLIVQSFALWQSYGGLTFYRAATRTVADVVIDTGRGSKYGFDGVGNVLAWAYMPCDAKDTQLQMMFDEAEPWSATQGGAGIYAPAVIRHEIGHILGLDHDELEGALMSPYYSASIFVPTTRDLDRYYGIYGVPAPAPEPTPAPTPTPAPGPAAGNYKVSGTATANAANQMTMSLQFTPAS
jgi:hypothetical protein